MSLRNYFGKVIGGTMVLASLIVGGCNLSSGKEDLGDLPVFPSSSESVRALYDLPPKTFAKITASNLFEAVKARNPNVIAGVGVGEEVKHTKAEADTQYTPHFEASSGVRYDRSFPDHRTGVSVSSGAAITQRFRNGIDLRLSADINHYSLSDSDSETTRRVGLDALILLPGSAELADRRVGDLAVLQRLKEDEARIIGSVRAELDRAIEAAYSNWVGTNDWLYAQKDVRRAELVRIKGFLLGLKSSDPKDPRPGRDLPIIDQNIGDADRIINITIPNLYDAAHRKIRAATGSDSSVKIDFSDIEFITRPSVPLEQAVEEVVMNDPGIARLRLEYFLAREQMIAASKKSDWKLEMGVFDERSFFGSSIIAPNQQGYAMLSFNTRFPISGGRGAERELRFRARMRNVFDEARAIALRRKLEIEGIYGEMRREGDTHDAAVKRLEGERAVYEQKLSEYVSGVESEVSIVLSALKNFKDTRKEVDQGRKAVTREDMRVRARRGLYDPNVSSE